MIWLSLKQKLRNPFLVIGGLILPVLVLMTKVNALGNYQVRPDQNFADLYIGVSMMAGILLIALLGFPTLIAQRQNDGVLKRLKYFGVSTSKYLMSELIAYLLVMVVSLIISMVVGVIFFKLHLPGILNLVSFMLHLIYAGLPVMLVGLLVTQVVRKTSYAVLINLVILIGLYYMMGIFGTPQAITIDQQFLSFSFPLTSIVHYEFYPIWINHVLIHDKFLIVNTSAVVGLGLLNAITCLFRQNKHSH